MEVPDLSYEVVLNWSAEDVAYIAEVPELPGCVSDGETRIEALENAEDAMRA